MKDLFMRTATIEARRSARESTFDLGAIFTYGQWAFMALFVADSIAVALETRDVIGSCLVVALILSIGYAPALFAELIWDWRRKKVGLETAESGDEFWHLCAPQQTVRERRRSAAKYAVAMMFKMNYMVAAASGVACILAAVLRLMIWRGEGYVTLDAALISLGAIAMNSILTVGVMAAGWLAKTRRTLRTWQRLKELL